MSFDALLWALFRLAAWFIVLANLWILVTSGAASGKGAAAWWWARIKAANGPTPSRLVPVLFMEVLCVLTVCGQIWKWFR